MKINMVYKTENRTVKFLQVYDAKGDSVWSENYRDAQLFDSKKARSIILKFSGKSDGNTLYGYGLRGEVYNR